MARKLSKEEQAKTRTDFDAPAWATKKEPPAKIAKRDDSPEPPKAEKTTEAKKRKGNPHGRPASANPRNKVINLKLTEEERAHLDEAARILETTKTEVIVGGIEYMYDKAAAQAWKQTSKEFEAHRIPKKGR